MAQIDQQKLWKDVATFLCAKLVAAGSGGEQFDSNITNRNKLFKSLRETSGLVKVGKLFYLDSLQFSNTSEAAGTDKNLTFPKQ